MDHCKRHPILVHAGKFSGRFLLHLTLSSEILGILIPYLLNLERHYFDPPLPFISQAVGCIPENGLFTFLMIPGSFLGFVLCLLLHSNPKNTDNVSKLINWVSLISCISYFFSWIIICAFPFAYVDVPSKYEWVCFVLGEHMIGALLMLGSCVFFSTCQTILCRNDRHWNTKMRITLVVIPVAIIGICSLLKLALEELEVQEGLSLQDVTYELPSKFSFNYIVTSICEWILVSSMWLSFGIFDNELKDSAIYLCVSLKDNLAATKKKN